MKNKKETFTKEEVQEMILEAFKKGENWGVTYGGWFLPTVEEKEKRAKKDCKDVYEKALTANK